MTILTLTLDARNHIIAMLEREGKKFVELSLEPQGCNGYKYMWTPTDKLQKNVVDLSENYKIVIDDTALEFVSGSEVVLGVIGLNKKLTILNPKEMGSCGCGESVNFK